MDATQTETIETQGTPLAFKVADGAKPSALLDGIGGGADTLKVEARQLAGHQKEAVVTQGAGGSAWRLCSDEGAQLHGTDIAPFPLGFFNAGIQGDLYGRLRALVGERRLAVDSIDIRLLNGYGLTGSFIRGTGQGHADIPEIEISLTGAAPAEALRGLVDAALSASPAIAYLRNALTHNTFALYINGRRRSVEGVPPSQAADVVDPYRVYSQAPRPVDPQARRDLVEKLDKREAGETPPSANSTDTRINWRVLGAGKPIDPQGLFSVDTWLGRAGASHFGLICEAGDGDRAPSGLAYVSAGIAFCYMTQLSRYIDNMKMNIHGVRLVQFNPYTAGEAAGAGPIDTHLFLNGDAPDETHLKLLTIAENTCYLHAAAKTMLNPLVKLTVNGTELPRAA
jgi:uncharacterized OsmC-like protein